MIKSHFRINLKSILILVFTILTCFATAFSFMGNSSNASGVVKLSEYTQTVVNERFLLKNDTITYEGREYLSSEVFLVCPDGSVISGERTVILSQIGDYEIVYTISVDGLKTKVSKGLTVKPLPYEVSSESSSFYFTNDIKMVQKKAGFSAEESDEQRSGIYVELSEGAEFIYNYPIDVSNFGLEVPILRIYPYNRSAYIKGDGTQCDAYSIVIRLTDCYDSNNYVDIEISYDASDSSKPDIREPYLRAGASNQIRTGFSETSPTTNVGDRKSFYIGNQRYVVATNTYGARDKVNWVVNADDNGFEFYYDNETKCIYQKSSRFYINYSVAESDGTHYYVNYIRTNEKGNYVYDETEEKYITVEKALEKNPDLVITEKYEYLGYYLPIASVLKQDENYATTPNVDLIKYKQDGYRKSPIATTLIADLDNEDAFDEVFKGFTTGEVYLSIKGDEYETSHLRFEIDKIGEYEGEELNFSSIDDEKYPVILFENKAISLSDTNYIIQGKKIKVPSVLSYDANLKDEWYEVYYEYGTEFERSVGVINGEFTPLNIGSYTVVYFAEDVFGNITKLSLNFTSIKTASKKTIEIEFSDLVEEFKTGEEVVLPSFEIKALNGNDKVKLSVYALYEDGTKIEVDKDTLKIIFENAGEYEIVFEYSDLFSNYSSSYSVVVKTSTNVLFGDIYLPEYFIKDATYTLDDVETFVFNEKYKTGVIPTVYASEDGGEYVQIDNTCYKVKGQNFVKFKYEYRGVFVESEKIPIVDVGFGDYYKLEKYFDGNFDAKTAWNGTDFSSKIKDGQNTLKFINVLSLSAFSVQFSIPLGKANFTSIEIKLIDFYDRTNSISLVYSKGNAGVEFNGITVEGVFENYTRTINFSSDNNSFVGTAGEKYRINSEFVSDKVICHITLKGITGESSLFLMKLGNQSVNNTDYDYGEPTIYYDQQAKGNKQLNAIVEILPCIPNDVLCPYNKYNLSFVMIAPDGNVVVAEDETPLGTSCDFTKAYKVKLSMYGTYVISYYYEDNCGNPISISYNINVVDTTSPTLVINGNTTVTTNAKLGDIVTIKEYFAEDMDSTVKTFILINNPKCEMYQLTGKTFEAILVGEYKIIYYCYDENGNFTIQHYTVVVK